MDKQVTLNEITLLLEEMAPPSLAEEWDNVGLLLGRRSRPVRKVLLALDLTRETAAQALAFGADLVITHHPPIFKSLKRITDADWQQELLLELAEGGVALYSAHTNLDAVAGGVNECLLRRLGIEEWDCLEGTHSLVRVGMLPHSCKLKDFARQAKEALAADYAVIADAGRPVRRIAVTSGSGSDFIDAVLACGADTFLTGDVRYHDAQRAAASGLNIIDAGHQATEWPVLEALADRLSLRFTEKNWDIVLKVAQEQLLLRHV